MKTPIKQTTSENQKVESEPTTIKQFVKYFAEKQETRIARIKAIQRLEQIIPQIKKDIEQCTKKKDSAQHRLIQIQIHSMTCLQDLKKQQHTIEQQVQKYQTKLKEMQQYRSQITQTKQKKYSLQKQLGSLAQLHEVKKLEIRQKIKKTKQKVEELREKVFLKRQLASKNFMIQYQEKVINDCKANRDQFKNYIKQLEGVIAERKAAHQQNLKQIQEYVKANVSISKKQLQNNIEKQSQIIYKKLQQTDNPDDFKMLLKIAGFNCQQVKLSAQEQLIINIFDKQYEPLNFQSITDLYKQSQTKNNQQQQQLDLFTKEIVNKLLKTDHSIQQQSQQINALQDRLQEISHKITKQNKK